MNREYYEISIGLEVHAELNTKTKVFCACPNVFGASPNTNCCPICSGMPGALPLLNKEAVKLAVKAGLLCGCKINEYVVFERKNYFYPDLGKSYQICQLSKPIGVGGGIKLSSGKYVRLNRLHLEEDAGKLIHSQNETFVDYNRAGLPLIECVSEPDISSVDEAIEFLTKLKNLFVFGGVSDCKMEQGGMRCDVNISVKRKGNYQYGTRIEMKNFNSLKSVAKAIEYETNRQIATLERGEKLLQETRRWDDKEEATVVMRTKEDCQDYRYFPEPDLLTLKISNEDIEKLRAELPVSQEKRIEKYTNEYNLPINDVEILVSSKQISDYFDKCVGLLYEPKEISNWILTDILKLNAEENFNVSPQNLVTIIKLVINKKISRSNAKILLEKVAESQKDAITIAKEMDFLTLVSNNLVMSIIDNLFKQNPKAVEDFEKTPDKVLQFFMGGVMKETQGKADISFAKEYIVSRLNKN